MKKTLMLAILGSAAAIQAMPTSTTDAPSPFGVSLGTETQTFRREEERNISKIDSHLYPTVSYEVNEETSFKLYPDITYTRDNDSSKVNYESTLSNAVLRWDQKKILSSFDENLDMKSSLRYYRNFGTSRDATKSDGILNLRLYPNYKFSDNFTLKNELRFSGYNLRRTGKQDGATYSKELASVTPTYTVDSKLTVASDVIYESKHTKKADAEINGRFNRYNSNKLTVSPFAEYAFTPEFTAAFQMNIFEAGTSIDEQKFTVAPYFMYNPTDKIAAQLTLEFQGRNMTQNFSKTVSALLELSLTAF